MFSNFSDLEKLFKLNTTTVCACVCRSAQLALVTVYAFLELFIALCLQTRWQMLKFYRKYITLASRFVNKVTSFTFRKFTCSTFLNRALRLTVCLSWCEPCKVCLTVNWLKVVCLMCGCTGHANPVSAAGRGRRQSYHSYDKSRETSLW